jgi:hypothetical protein
VAQSREHRLLSLVELVNCDVTCNTRSIGGAPASLRHPRLWWPVTGSASGSVQLRPAERPHSAMKPRVQPNLARAQRALGRLVATEGGGAAGDAGGPPDERVSGAAASATLGAAGRRPGVVKKGRRLSRKEQRREERKGIKAARHKHATHRTSPSTAKKPKDKAAGGATPGARDGAAATRVHPDGGSAGAAKAEDDSRKRKREKDGAGDSRSDRNALFYSLLEQDGLAVAPSRNGRGGAVPAAAEDPDDVEIRRMRKLLKLKKDDLADEGDGLDFILGYGDDARAEAKEQGVQLEDESGSEAEDDADEDDEEEEGEDDDDDDDDEDDDEALDGLDDLLNTGEDSDDDDDDDDEDEDDEGEEVDEDEEYGIESRLPEEKVGTQQHPCTLLLAQIH